MGQNAVRRLAITHAVSGYGLELVFSGPDVATRRARLVQDFRAAGICRATPAYSTRLWLGFDGREPRDIAGRQRFVDALCAVLAGAGEDARLASLVDWIVYHDFLASRQRRYLSILAYDAERARRLEAVRSSLLMPWLDGARAVRDLAGFRAFHTGLAPMARDAARYALAGHARLLYGGPVPASPFPGSERGWFAAEAAALLDTGWLKVASYSGQYVLAPGRQMRHLAFAAGELLEF